MCTCAFSLSIFMSFLYTNTNERLVVGQGRVPLAYVAHTGTRCAPVPSRFSSSCPCYTKQKCETDSYSGTRCAPVPSRFLFSCPYFTKPETKDGSYSGTRCYPKILKLSYLPYVPSLPYPHIYHRSFSVQVSLFVLVMTHCYWVLLRPPTKVGQSGGVAYIYIYTHTYKCFWGDGGVGGGGGKRGLPLLRSSYRKKWPYLRCETRPPPYL